ncbi:MAG TPA: ABC transporter substrate-binding protein [Geminicoccaceae bacterium]|nr:ABC transporter substrate-binding protein [Geminicoccus sp.]HMU48750.1 ABC transporter substrate-binding protein [Geminicoccaceae bacterium]
MKTIVPVVGALVGLAAAAPADAADKASLLLNWYMQGAHAQFFLGRERGFYADEGIELEIAEGRGSARSVQLVSNGDYQFGMADGGSLMTGVSKGLEAVAVMTPVVNSSYALVGLADGPIKTIGDVEGHSLGITAGDGLTQLWPAVVAVNNLDAGKIELVQMDPATKPIAVMEKRVDAILGGAQDQPLLIREKGYEPMVIPFYDVGVNTIGMSIVAHPALVKDNPDLVGRFVRASVKSYEAARQDPAAAVDAMLKVKADLDPGTIRAAVDGNMELITAGTPAGKPIGYGPAEAWEQTLEMMRKYREMSYDGKSTDFYTNDFIPQ